MDKSTKLHKTVQPVSVVCCVVTILIVSWTGRAMAQIPALPDIPQALPDEARQPLMEQLRQLESQRNAVLDEGTRHNQRCRQVKEGSVEYQECIASREHFNTAVQSLQAATDKLEGRIDAAIVAERKRLEARNKELTKSIDQDITAIRGLHLDRRSEDFEEWEKMGKSAKDQFENEYKTQLVDMIAKAAQDKMLDSFKKMDHKRVEKVIDFLQKNAKERDASMKDTIRILRQAANDKVRPRMALHAKAIVDGIDLGLEGAKAENNEEKLRFWLDFICDVAEQATKLKECSVFKSEGLVTVAALYNNATRRVALQEVEQLTQMTEQQLKALKKLNEMVVRHVKERNEVRNKLKELEQ